MKQKSAATYFGSFVVSLLSIGMAVFFYYNAVHSAGQLLEAGGATITILSLFMTSLFAGSGFYFGMHYLGASMKSKSTSFHGQATA